MRSIDDDAMNDEEFADVRAALGLAATPVTPSTGLKNRVMSAIAMTPQVAPGPRAETPPGATDSTAVAAPGAATTLAQARWFSHPATIMASAVAAVALFFGGVLAADLIVPRSPSEAERLATIVAAPDVSTVVSAVAGGGTATLVASDSVGLSAMVFEGLEPLSSDERYALWYITDGVPTAAGLFAVEDGGVVVHVLDGAFEAGTTVGVTIEPASGSVTPTSDPIVAIATA